MFTRAWKVYGATGHRQAVAFGSSIKYDWSKENQVRKVEVECADMTGTYDYVIVRVTRNTEAECIEEFEGQLSDGIFESSRYGRIEEA